MDTDTDTDIDIDSLLYFNLLVRKVEYGVYGMGLEEILYTMRCEM